MVHDARAQHTDLQSRAIPRTGERLHNHGGHDGRVEGIAFVSRDRLVSADVDAHVRRWDLATGQPTALPRPPRQEVAGWPSTVTVFL